MFVDPPPWASAWKIPSARVPPGPPPSIQVLGSFTYWLIRVCAEPTLHTHRERVVALMMLTNLTGPQGPFMTRNFLSRSVGVAHTSLRPRLRKATEEKSRPSYNRNPLTPAAHAHSAVHFLSNGTWPPPPVSNGGNGPQLRRNFPDFGGFGRQAESGDRLNSRRIRNLWTSRRSTR